MTEHNDLLDAALDRLRSDITFDWSPDRATAIFASGRRYADGDSVDVYVRVNRDGERVSVSDGGLTLARHDLSGLTDQAIADLRLWRAIQSDFGVEEASGRLYKVGPLPAAAEIIGLVADACLVLDSVRLSTRASTEAFAGRVQRFLRDEADLTVEPHRDVLDRYGNAQRVTALVRLESGTVVVQAAGGASFEAVKRSAEHAHWIFGGLDTATHPIRRRLAVLEVPRRDRAANRLSGLVKRLGEVAYVGSFDAQLSLNRFFREGPPESHDMATQSFDQRSLSAP